MRWKDTCEALSQCDSVNRSDDTSTNRRAVCSVLRGHLVCVRHVVHAIGHIALRLLGMCSEVVHIVP